MDNVFGINWNEVVFNGSVWIGALLGIVLFGVCCVIPVHVRWWMVKHNKKVPKLMQEHMGIIEIVWIVLLFNLLRFVKL